MYANATQYVHKVHAAYARLPTVPERGSKETDNYSTDTITQTHLAIPIAIYNFQTFSATQLCAFLAAVGAFLDWLGCNTQSAQTARQRARGQQ